VVVLHFQGHLPFGLRHADTTELATPEVIADFQESVPPTQVLHRYPGIGHAQDPDDLRILMPLLHVQFASVDVIGLNFRVLIK
jgi:hypothetical protein